MGERRVYEAGAEEERIHLERETFDPQARQVVNEFLELMRRAGNPGIRLFVSWSGPLASLIAIAISAGLGGWLAGLVGVPGWLGALLLVGTVVWAAELRLQWFIPVRRGWEVTSGTTQKESSTGWGFGPIEHWRIILTPRGSWYHDDQRVPVAPFPDVPSLVRALGVILRRNGLDWRET